MYKRELGELTICTVSNQDIVVSRESVLSTCCRYSCDVIYYVDNCGLLKGILCLDEIENDDDFFTVKKDFYSLREDDESEASIFFLEHPNVNKLPIIDTYGRIIGDYSRWEPLSSNYLEVYIRGTLKYNFRKYLEENGYNKIVIKTYENDSNELLNRLIVLFKDQNLFYEVVNCREKDVSSIDKLILVLLDEGVFSSKLEYGKTVNVISLKQFLLETWESVKRTKTARMRNNERNASESLFYQIRNKGIEVCALYNDIFYMSEYVKTTVNCNRKNRKKYPIANGEFWPIESSMGKAFFGSLLENDDYLSGKAQRELIDSHTKHVERATIRGKYYNVTDGKRKTFYQPTNAQHRIYMFGNCLIMGAYHEDKYTIASWLQKMLVDEGLSYKVINCGLYENVFESITKEEYRRGDYIIFWAGQDSFPDCDSIEIRKIYEKNRIPADWILNEFTHINHITSKCIAEELLSVIKRKAICVGQDKVDFCDDLQCGDYDSIKIEIDNFNSILGDHIDKLFVGSFISNNREKSNACIVIDLSVSPLLYIKTIKEIISNEKKLYIFVPQNIGKELYGYEYYINCLHSVFGDDKRIEIIPSDGFVPYFSYFHTYYYYYQNVKYILDEEAKLDIKIFSQCIATRLCIKKRYCISNISARQDKYNRILINELPKYGIKCVSIDM